MWTETLEDSDRFYFAFSADGGSNWFYYVHNERTDDDSLTYTVQLDDDLTDAQGWSTNGVAWVGDSAVDVDGYKTVTNRTDIGTAEFIRLQVQMD